MTIDTSHRRRRMAGRDPHEVARAATPLELLFDLTFVIAFGLAADELAHALTEDHPGSGLLGFGFATFAISWAWINFTWFASAYDTDDWIYRLTTMVQMFGVLVLALGLADVFESLAEGEHVDNTVLVAGYVVMRVPMIAQWLRARRQDPARAEIARTMALTLAVAQVGWIALVFADLGVAPMLAIAAVLILVELSGPLRAERLGNGTPWHAHHMAERYGLLVIVTLGEGLLGTMATLVALVGPEGPGWSFDVVALGLAGTALTFGLWWCYFALPFGPLLHHHRERSFGWGYGHIVMFGSIVAVGAGLHAAAYLLEDHSELGDVATSLTVAVPVAVFFLVLFALYVGASRRWTAFHTKALLGSLAVVVASVILTSASLVWGLVLLSLAPWVVVLAYERGGHEHDERLIESLGERHVSTGGTTD